MLLRIGELAKRTGLTVRTLHHYDDIGLLKPSMRSEAGYRLYRRQDIDRLHRIQALQSLGMTLSDIGTLLDQPSPPMATVIERQIHMLEQQIAHRRLLCDRLRNMHRQFVHGEEPAMGDWLKTLELMTMYDRYFTPEELNRLQLYQADAECETQWQNLITQAETLLSHNALPSSTEAQELAKRWMTTLERDTDGDPRLLDKLNAMHANEPGVQNQLGISTQVADFVMQALASHKLAIYRQYLSEDEFQLMSENYPQCMHEWPPLMAQLRQLVEDQTPPEAPAAQQLAGAWLALLRRFAGDNLETHARIRQANEQEPELKKNTWMNEPMQEYLTQAVTHLMER
uniref:MerR family transcriptional regulator n=1 Tax=Halomonas sp. TaxID=1486246 RepID=UPI002609F04E|nr:MerR family transcriptional regulator [Halomonas sp.]